jgi:hypothetical protein
MAPDKLPHLWKQASGKKKFKGQAFQPNRNHPISGLDIPRPLPKLSLIH